MIQTFITGFLVGTVFGLLKLPVPAPATWAGVFGIVGIVCGYLLFKH